MLTYTEFIAAPLEEEQPNYRTLSREETLDGGSRMLELLNRVFPNLPIGTSWQVKAVIGESGASLELRFRFHEDKQEHQAANNWIQAHYPRQWTDHPAPLPAFNLEQLAAAA